MGNWGPAAWRFIHSVCKSCTDRAAVITWLRATLHVLPCPECCIHAQQYIAQNPPEDSQDLLKWSFEFHNSVNRRLNRREMSFEDALWALEHEELPATISVPLGLLAGSLAGFFVGKMSERAKIECPASDTE
jgi:hypothetical protein